MNTKTCIAFLLAFVYLFVFPKFIAAKDHTETIASVNKRLDALVMQKAKKVSVDQLLNREGYKTEFNQQKNTIYATKFYSEGLLVSRKHILIIQLDQAHVITSYESTQGLIGT